MPPEVTPPNCGPWGREERRETGAASRSLVFRVVPGSTNRKGAWDVDAHPNGLQLGRRHPAARDPTKDGTSQCRNGGTATQSCWREPAPTRRRTGAAQLVGAAAFESVTYIYATGSTRSLSRFRFHAVSTRPFGGGQTHSTSSALSCSSSSSASSRFRAGAPTGSIAIDRRRFRRARGSAGRPPPHCSRTGVRQAS